MEIMSMDNSSFIRRILPVEKKKWGVITVLLTVEFLHVGIKTVSKSAKKRGMNDSMCDVMYSNALASWVLLLLFLIFDRKRGLTPLTGSIVGQFFLLAFLTWNAHMLRILGIDHISPMLASAMSDLVPAFTFVLAIIFRKEKMDCSKATLAKSFGALVSVTGALLITLYKGPPVISGHSLQKSFPELFSSLQFNWALWAMLLAASSFVLSPMHMVEAWVVNHYPEKLMIQLTRSMFITILSIPVSMISERDRKACRLGFNIDLVYIICSAISSHTFHGVIHIWARGKMGPVFVALFKPLGRVIAVAMGITFLGDTLYVGGTVGAAIITAGFCAAIWGKAQEEKMVNKKNENSDSVSSQTPLLTAEQKHDHFVEQLG